MRRRREQLGGRAFFDDATGVHHHDTVADPRDNVDVVRDDETRQTAFLPQPTDEFENLTASDDVEGRRRFVEDENGRFDRERPRDGDPLALSPGEPSNGAGGEERIEPDLAKQRGGSGETLAP